MEEEEKLLTPEEAARRLSISSSSLRRYIERGLLNFYELPSSGFRIRRRFSQAHLDEFLKRLRQRKSGE